MDALNELYTVIFPELARDGYRVHQVTVTEMEGGPLMFNEGELYLPPTLERLVNNAVIAALNAGEITVKPTLHP